MIVSEVCMKTGLLLVHPVGAFPGNIMLQNIGVIPWFNFTTFNVVSLKACSTLESLVVVSDHSFTVLALLFPVCWTRCSANVPAHNQKTTVESGVLVWKATESEEGIAFLFDWAHNSMTPFVFLGRLPSPKQILTSVVATQIPPNIVDHLKVIFESCTV